MWKFKLSYYSVKYIRSKCTTSNKCRRTFIMVLFINKNLNKRLNFCSFREQENDAHLTLKIWGIVIKMWAHRPICLMGAKSPDQCGAKTQPLAPADRICPDNRGKTSMLQHCALSLRITAKGPRQHQTHQFLKAALRVQPGSQAMLKEWGLTPAPEGRGGQNQ